MSTDDDKRVSGAELRRRIILDALEIHVDVIVSTWEDGEWDDRYGCDFDTAVMITRGLVSEYGGADESKPNHVLQRLERLADIGERLIEEVEAHRALKDKVVDALPEAADTDAAVEGEESDDNDDELTCPVCGAEKSSFSSPWAFGGHKRSCRTQQRKEQAAQPMSLPRRIGG